MGWKELGRGEIKGEQREKEFANTEACGVGQEVARAGELTC